MDVSTNGLFFPSPPFFLSLLLVLPPLLGQPNVRSLAACKSLTKYTCFSSTTVLAPVFNKRVPNSKLHVSAHVPTFARLSSAVLAPYKLHTCFSLPQGSLRRPRIQRTLVLLLLELAQQSGFALVLALVLALVVRCWHTAVIVIVVIIFI